MDSPTRLSRDPGARRARGVVFTPAPLAAEVVAKLAALAPAGAPLLDPACGDGAILLAAARQERWGALDGLERDPELVSQARARLPAARITHGDALDPGRPWPAGAWVAANPPWVSFSGRQSGRRAGRTPTAASTGLAPVEPRAAAGAEGGGWPSLHGAFVERIARHVAAEGTGAVVLVPASLVDLAGYAPLRRRVEQWARPAEVRELGERAFPGVVEPAVELVLLPRRESGPEPAADRAAGEGWSRTEAARSLEVAFARCPRLPDRSFADPGVHTGNSARLLVRPLDEEQHPPVAQGRDLRPYFLGPASARLRTDLERRAGRRFRVAPLAHYAAFPIVLRQTANRPLAALHEPRGYFRNTLLACREVAGLDPAFLVAVLNSPPATAWHRARYRDARQRRFPQVKVGHLATQPIPIAHRDQAPELHDELVRRVRALAPDAPGFEREVDAIGRQVTDAFGLAAEARARVEALARDPGSTSG